METIDLSYINAVGDLTAAQHFGLCGVEVQENRLVPTSGLTFVPITDPFREPFQGVEDLVGRAVRVINEQHRKPVTRGESSWSDEEIGAFFDAEQRTFAPWNSHTLESLRVVSGLWTVSEVFDPALFKTYYLNRQLQPLIVSPKRPMTAPEFCIWAKAQQEGIAVEQQKHGAIFYRGFSVAPAEFPGFFEAATGSVITPYHGDSPRKMVDPQKHVAESTRVDPSSKIPPHQEDAGHPTMPDDLGFCCVTPSQRGTGETGLTDAREVGRILEAKHPDLWNKLCSRTVNYTACYHPDDRWTLAKLLNPSQATVKQKFGTDDIGEIKRLHENEGCSIRQDQAGRVFVTRKNIPAVQLVGNRPVFCNQIHFHKLTPELTGGGWQNRAAHWLYPEGERQYDATWGNGEPISEQEASIILNALKACETDPISWQMGEVRIYDNRIGMHSKWPHSNPWLNPPRQILFVGGKRP